MSVGRIFNHVIGRSKVFILRINKRKDSVHEISQFALDLHSERLDLNRFKRNQIPLKQHLQPKQHDHPYDS